MLDRGRFVSRRRGVSAEQKGRPFTVSSRSAREAIRAVAERFVEFGEEIVSEDPLDWPGYEEQLARAREKSGEREAAIVGEARIVEAFARARESRRLVVSLVATGGARMQEGMCSLVQLQRIANACARARAEG